MPKILTEAQIEKFWRDGCVFPIRVMSEREALEIRRRLDDPQTEITISLITGYVAFLPAEELGDFVSSLAQRVAAPLEVVPRRLTVAALAPRLGPVVGVLRVQEDRQKVASVLGGLPARQRPA